MRKTLFLLKLEVDKLNNKEGVDQHLKNLAIIKLNKEEGSKEIKKTKILWC